MNEILTSIENDYNTNPDFKNIIDKIPIVESIYKGLKKSEIPKIEKMLEELRQKTFSKQIQFGNIVYDLEDFLSIDINKIEEDETTKIVGLSCCDEKLVRKYNLHKKNLIECLKIIGTVIESTEQTSEVLLFNSLLFMCLSVYMIIGKEDFIKQNVSAVSLNVIEKYKTIIESLLV